MTDEKIIEELIKYANDVMTHHNAYPFVAFIVKNGEIVSRAYNKRVNLFGDKTTHGEMEAINAVNKSQPSKKSVILEDGFELFSSCEPCLACFDTALWANIKKFVFSVDHHDFPDYFHDHPYTIEQYQKENPNEILVTRNQLHSEGIELFKKAKQLYGW